MPNRGRWCAYLSQVLFSPAERPCAHLHDLLAVVMPDVIPELLEAEEASDHALINSWSGILLPWHVNHKQVNFSHFDSHFILFVCVFPSRLAALENNCVVVGLEQWFFSLGRTLESPGELLKLPMLTPNPKPIKSESLSLGPRHRCFLKLPADRSAAKTENCWLRRCLPLFVCSVFVWASFYIVEVNFKNRYWCRKAPL